MCCSGQLQQVLLVSSVFRGFSSYFSFYSDQCMWLSADSQTDSREADPNPACFTYFCTDFSSDSSRNLLPETCQLGTWTRYSLSTSQCSLAFCLIQQSQTDKTVELVSFGTTLCPCPAVTLQRLSSKCWEINGGFWFRRVFFVIWDRMLLVLIVEF